MKYPSALLYPYRCSSHIKSLFYDLIAEALEDIAMINAIKEGEETKPASRAEIFSILEENE